MGDLNPQASAGAFAGTHASAQSGPVHALVAAIELLPEKPMGRRGSRQLMDNLRQLLEVRLPSVLQTVRSAGGQTVLLHHTELIALLPVKGVDRKALTTDLMAAPGAELKPAVALVAGLVERRAFDNNTAAFCSGAAIEEARTALMELLSGETATDRDLSVPSGTPELGRQTTGVPVPREELATRFSGLCAVALSLTPRTAERVAGVAEMAQEFDGTLLLAEAFGGEAIVLLAFTLDAGTQASERRTGDFALLLRDQYGDAVRMAVSSGDLIYVEGDSGLYGTAGEPLVEVTDLLQHAEAGQVLTNGRTAEQIAPAFAVQPVGGVTHGGKRSPAGTTILLWRELSSEPTDLFVGRVNELAAMRDYLSQGSRAALRVVGPPGIGKSTLVGRTIRNRPASSILCVAGSDRPEAPFASLTDGIRAYWGLPELESPQYTSSLGERIASARSRIWDDELLEEWDRVEQFIQHALGREHPVASALDPESRYQGMVDGLHALMCSLQAIRVLWVDDFQWIDSGSAEVLSRWLAGHDPARLRVLTTVRTGPDQTPEAPQRTLGWDDTEIAISGLTEESARALLDQRGTTDLVSEPDVQLILSHCQGNPFFLEQCARFVADEINAGSEPRIPESVHAVILARIKRLTSNVRQAVEMAAVLGLRFDMRILSAMLREEKLPNALQSAQQEGFWEAASELNFIFCHALIRDAIYDAQFESRRAELHAAAVRAFEHVYSGEARRAHLYQLAEHCELAGQSDSAIRYHAEAAEYALEQYENDRAVGLLRRRLALSGRTDLHAVLDLAKALERTGAWEETAQLLESATAREIESLPKDQAHAFALCTAAYADLLIERGETNEAEALARSAISAVDGRDLNEGVALLYRSVGLAQFQRAEYEAALGSFQTALEYARASQDERTVGRLMNNVAVVHSRIGRHREALSAFQSNLELARRLNDFLGKSSALNNIGYLYNEMGEFEKAMPYFEEDLALCIQAGHRQGQAIANGNIASILASLGRHEAAISRFRKTIEIDTRIGFLPHKAYNLQQLGTSLIASGIQEEGCACLLEAAELAEEIEFPMVKEKAAESLTGCPDDEEKDQEQKEESV